MEINKDIISREIDKECYLIDPKRRILHTFNETGNFIFKLISKKHTSDEIINKISEEFQIDKKEAEKDLNDFISKLKENGII